jgi:hypothetical protein
MSRRLSQNLAYATLAIALALFADAASAAGSYDGTWRGASTMRYGVGCAITTSTMVVVRGAQIDGTETIPPDSFLPAGEHPIRGAISADGGAFQGSVGDWPFRGKFAGDSFEGDYEFGQCTMVMRLQRVK